MPPTLARDFQPRKSRKASTATLIALLALAAAAQALGPASAAAMIDQQIGTCSPIVGNLGWNYTTNEPCTLTAEEAGGGSADGGAGVAPTPSPIPGTGNAGEVIEIHDPLACPNRLLCLPSGGGTKGSIRDGDSHIGDGPKPRGGASKGEVKKPKPKPKKPAPKPKPDGMDQVRCQAVEDRLAKTKNEVIAINNVARPRVGGDLALADIDNLPSERLEPEGRDYWRQQKKNLLKLKADVERYEKRLKNPGCKED